MRAWQRRTVERAVPESDLLTVYLFLAWLGSGFQVDVLLGLLEFCCR